MFRALCIGKAQIGLKCLRGLDKGRVWGFFREFMAFPRELNTGSWAGVCDPAAGVGVAALAGEGPVWEVLGWGEKSSAGIELHWDTEHTLEPVK